MGELSSSGLGDHEAHAGCPALPVLKEGEPPSHLGNDQNDGVYHVELRQFPHTTVSFNLSREQLDDRILGPWVAGRAVELNERRWSPEKARITIVEGPPLELEAIGLGRGWANAVRAGEKVTDELLAEARSALPAAERSRVGSFKQEIGARTAAGGMSLQQLVALAGECYPGLRISDRVALSERAVWELLHEGPLTLRRDGELLARDAWQPVLLSWDAWSTSRVSIAADDRH